MKVKSLYILILLFALSPIFSHAQTTETTDQREARLKKELAQVEKEQAETEKILAETQNQSASITRDITILSTKIKAAQLNIKAKNLVIEGLGKDINNKQKKINDLEGNINRGKETLRQIMRKTSEVDSYSLAEFLLARDNLSQVFIDLDNFESVQQSLKETFEEIRDNKTQTESEKNTLSKRKDQEIDAKAVIESEKKSIESNEKEKQRLLAISRGNEVTYAQELAKKKAKAAEIRAALFSLRDAAAIPFGDALRYANEASKVTGVRPAFLLAILTQESNLGKDVGSCLVTDLKTGNGAGKNTGTAFERVMYAKPTGDTSKRASDTVAFEDITERLGRDWKMTPVSCPPEHKYYIGRGFGGGMGPSQFIPSTWELFKDSVGKLIGLDGDYVDPWNPQHAFMATAVYMRNLGAGASTYSAERNAACRYYSGAACTPGRVPANVFYGDQVMVKADTIQRTMIDPLQGL